MRRSRDEAVSVVKRAFDDADIEIPFLYRMLTFKEPLSFEELGAPSSRVVYVEAGGTA